MLDILQKICDNAKNNKHNFGEVVSQAVDCDYYDTPNTMLAELLSMSVMAEVLERYQLCPLDMRGVPIHAGDELETVGEVQAIGEDIVCAGELITSRDSPHFAGYAIYTPWAYSHATGYAQILKEFAAALGTNADPGIISLYESKLKDMQ